VCAKIKQEEKCCDDGKLFNLFLHQKNIFKRESFAFSQHALAATADAAV